MADQLEALVQKMIDAGESEENIATVIREQSAKKPAQAQVRSRTGQMYTPYTDSGSKEFVGGAVGAVKDTLNPMTYVNLAKRAYNDPVGLAKDTAMAPIRLAGRMVTDPAETLGGLTAGAVMGKVLPGPRGAARGIGTAVETVGKKGAWPIRMVGSHTLGAGNPLGAAMVAAPEAIEGVGTKLRQWGENDPALQAEAIKKFHGGEKPKAVTPEPIKVAEGKNVEDAWDRAKKAGGDAGSPNVGDPQGDAALRKAGFDPETIARLRARGAVSKLGETPTQPPAGTVRVAPPKPAETPATKFSREEVVGKDRVTGHFKEGNGGLGTADTLEPHVVPPTSDFDEVMAKTHVPDIEVVEGGGKPTAARMPIRLAAPVRASAIPDEWLEAYDKALTKTKSSDKSFLGQNASKNDIHQARALFDAGLSPEEAAEQAEMLKAGRHTIAYENAKMNKQMRSQYDREPE